MSGKAFFIGDHVALDFLNTIAAPRGDAIEFIADGHAYVDWLTDAGLLDPTEAQELLGRFSKPVLDRAASEARELREWFRQVMAKPVGAQARWRTAEVVARINQILAMDRSHRQLEVSGKHLLLQERHEYTQVRQLLVPVAHAIAELATDGDQALVKSCANPQCTLWFYDRTKAHRRMFCSMAVCGNRAKVAAFRKRQRALK